MGILVRLVCGIWEKTYSSVWSFSPDPNEQSYGVIMQENDTYSTVEGVIRARYGVSPETSIALTYAFPEWMNIPNDPTTPPIDIRDTDDVQLFMAVRMECPEMPIFVTIGAYAVDRYRFQKSSSYRLGEPSRRDTESTTNVSEPLLALGNTGDLTAGNESPTGPLDFFPDNDAIFWNGLLADGWVTPSEQYIHEIINNTGYPIESDNGNDRVYTMHPNFDPRPTGGMMQFLNHDLRSAEINGVNRNGEHPTPTVNTAVREEREHQLDNYDQSNSGDNRRWFAVRDPVRNHGGTADEMASSRYMTHEPPTDEASSSTATPRNVTEADINFTNHNVEHPGNHNVIYLSVLSWPAANILSGNPVPSICSVHAK